MGYNTVMSEQTKWHEIFAAVQQEHLSAVGIEVSSEFDVVSKPPRGDMIIAKPSGQTEWTEEQRNYLPDGIRESVAKDNILELKYTESVNQAVFEQVIAYSHLYRTSRHLKREKVRCFILSSHSTNEETRQVFDYHPTEQGGVYHSDNILLQDVPLILLNELSGEPHNLFFKLFGSRQAVKEAALSGIKQWWIGQSTSKLLLIIHSLWEKWFKQGDMDMGVITVESILKQEEEFNRLLIQKTPDAVLEELLADSPFVKRLKAKQAKAERERAEAETKAKQEAEAKLKQERVRGIIQALLIRFKVDRATWAKRLEPVTFEQLAQLQEPVLQMETLAEFEVLFQQLEREWENGE